MKGFSRRGAAAIILALLIIGLGIIFWPFGTPGHSPSSSTNLPGPSYPLDRADSLWVIVNKGRVLPAGYVPAGLKAPNVPLRLQAGNPEMQLRSDAAAALEEMTHTAAAQNIKLMLASGYRSYSEQETVYASELQAGGQAKADAVSAHPGYSEHQTGLAADLEPTSRVCELQTCFADTLEGRWLAANAYKYGFIIRYQKDKTAQTGYNYEPWHIRFIGKPLAAVIQTKGVTLEQYFQLPFFTNYAAVSLQLK